MNQITNDELIEMLKDRLVIKVDFYDAGDAPWAGDHKLKIKLKIGSTTISESETYLPNTSQKSEY